MRGGVIEEATSLRIISSANLRFLTSLPPTLRFLRHLSLPRPSPAERARFFGEVNGEICGWFVVGTNC